MTASIMPERARKIATEIAEKHGYTFADITAHDRKADIAAARREVYARLMLNYTSHTIGGWLNRHPDHVIRGARVHRAFLGTSGPPVKVQGLPVTKMAFSLWRGMVEVHVGRKTMLEIANQVARASGLTVDDLRGPDRSQGVSLPRHHAMYLMSQQDHLSFSAIGRFFGGRDHTTVSHGVRAHAARLAAEWSGREAA